MPRHCSAYGCRSNYESDQQKFVPTFSLPRSEELRAAWLKNIPNDLSKLKNPVICEKHFDESQIIRKDCVVYKGEYREYNRKIPKLKEGAVPYIFKISEHLFNINNFETADTSCNSTTGVSKRHRKRLKEGVNPSLLLPTSDSVSPYEKSLSQQKYQLKTGVSKMVQSRIKCVPGKNSELKNSSQTSSAIRKCGFKEKEESKEIIKRKRKSTTNETSDKKVHSSSNLNRIHTSNGVLTSEKSDNENSRKNDKPVCTNIEAFLNVQLKEEFLSDEEMPINLFRKNLENTSDSMQITNVRSLSKERSVKESSAEENARKKPYVDLNSDFYSQPLDMDQRDKAFGSFVACELSNLHANPTLYIKTKQSILKLLTEANFEQITFGNMS